MATNHLKALLEHYGIRQTELARECDLSPSLVNKVANERRTPSPTSMARMARGLTKLVGEDVPVERIFPNHSRMP